MTIQPVGLLHPLTVVKYLGIGEVEPGYTELIEGRLLLSPTPVPDHNHVAGELNVQLCSQLPDGLELIRALDVDLQLAPPTPRARSAVPT